MNTSSFHLSKYYMYDTYKEEHIHQFTTAYIEI